MFQFKNLVFVLLKKKCQIMYIESETVNGKTGITENIKTAAAF